MSVNIPPEGRGNLNLKCRAYIAGAYRECLVIEADAIIQRVQVVICGSLVNANVPFTNIQNVALVYDDGTVLKSFGAPKPGKPETIEYIRGFQEAYL